MIPLVVAYFALAAIQICIGEGELMAVPLRPKPARRAVKLILTSPLAPVILPILTAKKLYEAWHLTEQDETK